MRPTPLIHTQVPAKLDSLNHKKLLEPKMATVHERAITPICEAVLRGYNGAVIGNVFPYYCIVNITLH